MKRIVLFVLCIMGSFMLQGDVITADQEIVDGIVAVIGDEIVLLSELQRQIHDEMMRREMSLEKTPRNELLALREEVIQGMVENILLIEKARRDSIEVDMQEVDLELKNRIAEFKKQVGGEEAYLNALEEFGFTELQLRNKYREDIYKDFLRQRLVYTMRVHISVTPQDIEGWFAANKDSLPEVSEKYKVSHILIYPEISEEKKQAAREKIQGILERVRAGDDFAELAKQYSEDPGTVDKGGDLGYFKRGDYLSDFTSVAYSLQKGEVSDVVETQLGYHIIKVEDIRGDEVRARHILIRLTIDETDEMRVAKKLKQIRDDILSGKSTFEEMAKQYSEDENSRELGGKLDWFARDVMIPSFPREVEKIEKGQISEPFKSQFGYHILRLDDHKPSHTLNIKDDRAQIEELIKQKKTIEEYYRIINQLREETYIDIRLD